MIIKLEQKDIVKAIRAHLETVGISLRNQNVEIEFSAGRKENGLTAEVNVNDIEIPGLNTPGQLPALDVALVGGSIGDTSVGSTGAQEAPVAETPAEPAPVVEAEAAPAAEAPAAEAVPAEEAPADVKPTGSIFG